MEQSEENIVVSRLIANPLELFAAIAILRNVEVKHCIVTQKPTNRWVFKADDSNVADLSATHTLTPGDKEAGNLDSDYDAFIKGLGFSSDPNQQAKRNFLINPPNEIKFEISARLINPLAIKAFGLLPLVRRGHNLLNGAEATELASNVGKALQHLSWLSGHLMEMLESAQTQELQQEDIVAESESSVVQVMQETAQGLVDVGVMDAIAAQEIISAMKEVEESNGL